MWCMQYNKVILETFVYKMSRKVSWNNLRQTEVLEKQTEADGKCYEFWGSG